MNNYRRRLPVMADLSDIVGLGPLLENAGFAAETALNFEALYATLRREVSMRRSWPKWRVE